MDFKEFGNQDGRTLLLLPGTACTWQLNFKNVIDELAEKYRIIAVNYDGFEGDPGVVFTDMLTVTEKIEDYIIQNHGGRVDGAYGSSLGGSFAGLLIQRGRVHIDHGFIDSMKGLNPRTISRQFYSDYVTPLEDDIHADGTTVHVVYALKMGEKYGRRYRRHFRDPDIHEFDTVPRLKSLI